MGVVQGSQASLLQAEGAGQGWGQLPSGWAASQHPVLG